MKNYRNFLGTLHSKLHMLIHMIVAALLLIISFLKYSQNLFILSFPLYTSCLFSMLLNENIVDIEKPDEICLPTFVVDDFPGLFLHPSIFSIQHSRSAYIINAAL